MHSRKGSGEIELGLVQGGRSRVRDPWIVTREGPFPCEGTGLMCNEQAILSAPDQTTHQEESWSMSAVMSLTTERGPA